MRNQSVNPEESCKNKMLNILLFTTFNVVRVYYEEYEVTLMFLNATLIISNQMFISLYLE